MLIKYTGNYVNIYFIMKITCLVFLHKQENCCNLFLNFITVQEDLCNPAGVEGRDLIILEYPLGLLLPRSPTGIWTLFPLVLWWQLKRSHSSQAHLAPVK